MYMYNICYINYKDKGKIQYLYMYMYMYISLIK